MQYFNHGLAKARVMRYESINFSLSVNLSVSNNRNESLHEKYFTMKISGFMVHIVWTKNMDMHLQSVSLKS